MRGKREKRRENANNDENNFTSCIELQRDTNFAHASTDFTADVVG